jgi:hypothetical protein
MEEYQETCAPGKRRGRGDRESHAKKALSAGKTTAQLDVSANIRSILIQRNTLTIY